MGILVTLSWLVLLPAICFAPPLPLRPSTGTGTNPVIPAASEPAVTESEPVEESDEEVRHPLAEKVLRATLPAAHTPAKHGQTDGPYLIAQRTIVEDYCGWGWVRKEDDTWRQARWIAIEPTVGVCPIPHTFLPRPEDDNNQQYRFYGDFAPYRAYEPQADMWVDVFILKGFLSLGPAEPIRRDPPAQASSRPNRFAERGANMLRP
ncbi:MAG: hypothetical protein NTZ01_05415 [Verrucomicrobia bacterium]|nr:hypothetical protein [Verrucomicrobiota bacterium]